MFMAWMRTVGGRLESRLSFSSTITWNNFPLPALSVELKGEIVAGGHSVLAARALTPERALEEQYKPTAMEPALQGAHRKLDRFVDRAFGINKSEPTLRDRQAILFRRYEELTSPLFGSVPKGRRRK